MTGWRGALLWKRLWKELAKQLRAELAIARSSLDTVERERESRINALTAELEQAKAYAAKADEALLDCATAYATERTAREQAEERFEYAQTAHEEALGLLHQERGARQQAERERDAALARVKELEISEAALKGMVERQALNMHDLREEKENWVKRTYCTQEVLEAAESALASARELLTRWITWLKGKDNRRALIADTRAWLSSAPSPAPERSDKRSRWNELGELPVTVMATSEYPSTAPCSGCASARELLQKIAARKECHREVLGWLKERGE